MYFDIIAFIAAIAMIVACGRIALLDTTKGSNARD